MSNLIVQSNECVFYYYAGNLIVKFCFSLVDDLANVKHRRRNNVHRTSCMDVDNMRCGALAYFEPLRE
jgi:hypothetical protein